MASIVTGKTVALAVLAAIAFASPLIERFASGRVESFSTFGLIEALVSLVVLFCWYHLDKREHGYEAGRLMNAGVLVAAVIALPIYFVRSRGWKRGTITIALAAAFVAGTFVLGEMGEWLGALAASL